MGITIGPNTPTGIASVTTGIVIEINPNDRLVGGNAPSTYGSSFGGGPQRIVYSDTNLKSCGTQLNRYTLALGNNTISVPTNAVGLWFYVNPPDIATGSVLTVTWKGVNGDAGYPLGLRGPSRIVLTDVAPASIVINLSGTGQATLPISIRWF